MTRHSPPNTNPLPMPCLRPLPGTAAPPCRPAPKQVASFPTGVWSGVFLLLSAADHLLVSLPRVNSVYNRLLCANRNPFRWAEYSGERSGLCRKLRRGQTGFEPKQAARQARAGSGQGRAARAGRRPCRRRQRAAWRCLAQLLPPPHGRLRPTQRPSAHTHTHVCPLTPTPQPPNHPCPVSASLMTVMIAQLSGVTDIHLLFTLAALMASTMLFGWQMEVANGRRIPAYQFTSDSRLPPAELPPSKGVSVSAAAGVPASFISNAAYAPGPADASFGAEGPAGPGIQWGPFLMGCWPFVACYAVIACYFFQARTLAPRTRAPEPHPRHARRCLRAASLAGSPPACDQPLPCLLPALPCRPWPTATPPALSGGCTGSRKAGMACRQLAQAELSAPCSPDAPH